MNAQIAKATLLPCPFCGGEAEVRTAYIEKERKDVPMFSYARCGRCFAQTFEFAHKNSDRTGVNPAEEAAKAWNRRSKE